MVQRATRYPRNPQYPAATAWLRTWLTRALEWMECDKILLFSSDYPHWTFDDPRWLVKHLPEHARDAVMWRNGVEVYELPTTVPVLEGQTRVF